MRQSTKHPGQSESARADIYRRLREAILCSDFKPGEPLSENALAARFGVSRTPVRDALAHLSQEGLVDVFPQRGSAVARISADRAGQTAFMRRVLEVPILRQAARTLEESQAQKLQQSFDRQLERLKNNDTLGFLLEELEFRRGIYTYCGRGPVWEAYRPLWSDALRVQFLRLQTFHYRQAPAHWLGYEYDLTEGRMLLDALRGHDEAAAERLAGDAIDAFLRDMQRLRDLFPHYFVQEDLHP